MTNTMVGFGRCSNCGKSHWARHKCQPAFQVHILDEQYQGYEDSPKKIFAETAQNAACRFIEQWENNGANYDVAYGNTELTVCVWVASDFDELGGVRLEIESITESLADPDEEMEPEDRSLLEAQLEKLRLQVPALEAKKQLFLVRGQMVPEYWAELKQIASPSTADSAN